MCRFAQRASTSIKPGGLQHPGRKADKIHPRSRGEHAGNQSSFPLINGSSPLTRGAPEPAAEQSLVERLIPAHAGSTPTAPRPPTATAAHPRSRGEHVASSSVRILPTGSSPLTRGAHRSDLTATRRARLIPAHAGSTKSRLPFIGWRRAHPRSRGEHFFSLGAGAGAVGSSPLTRGAPRGRAGKVPAARLIPAHAGSTTPAPANPSGGPAHPRSRGEHPICVRQVTENTGSSPLTRGARPSTMRAHTHQRLIPAHAGSTHPTYVKAPVPTAHPRSRGEHAHFNDFCQPLAGSSPLTRGARQPRPPDKSPTRLIPAHAGSTPQMIPSSLSRTAHPRSRGEHALPCDRFGTVPGSSPLTRGAPTRFGLHAMMGGLIPAHAGSTP